jgi:hypothetical protein
MPSGMRVGPGNSISIIIINNIFIQFLQRIDVQKGGYKHIVISIVRCKIGIINCIKSN